ncbi:MAG: UDP-N-acetylmuramate dehydrogenase [Candidatus Hydrogenedens sp.]|nr:UDP-N-acetylmuramate dehydrogenase [Candidatus Hydrogenedens sp.]
MQCPPFEFAHENYPLAPVTLYNIGGPARVALVPRDAAELETAYAWMIAQDAPRLILGGGSNVLISDDGFPGVVLFTTGLKRFEPLGGHRYYVGSGLDLDWMVQEIMLANNYEGVGGLTGIPGSVGGAIYMNAGTVNGWTCMFMDTVDLVGPEGPRTVEVTQELWGYRGQRFCPPGDAILGGVFHFAPSERNQRAIYAHYIQRRKEKQPQGHCCGSVFKNPEGDHAGRLIESCGLKGTRRGGAIISPMHANFVMNDQDASFDDVFGLIQLMRQTVLDTHGIELEPEVRIIA